MVFEVNANGFPESVNGCHIVSTPGETQKFPFCSEVIVLNETNKMGIEFNWDVRVRIDGVIATDLDSFIKMMDALVIVAKKFGYNKLFFADYLSDEVLEMFLFYGFTEIQVQGDDGNHYLDYTMAEDL